MAKELEKLRKVYADTRKTLEEEMLCRIDMENTVQSLREELSFKDQVFQQELQETRTRRQVEISEIGKWTYNYEDCLNRKQPIPWEDCKNILDMLCFATFGWDL